MERSWKMMDAIEEQLTAGMRERVAGITITTDIVGETLRIQQRRTVITRTAYAVGVLGLAGVLTAGALAIPGSAPNRPAVTRAASPELRLAAAVAASQSTSYRVKITINYRTEPDTPPMIVDGAFDPATTTGYLRLVFADGGRYEERLIEGDRYNGNTGTNGEMVWGHIRGKYTTLVFLPKSGMFAAVSADPQSQFDLLKRSGAKISQTGPGTYHFENAFPVYKNLDDNTMVGDVTVGADQRVAKVAYKITLHARSAPANAVTLLDVTMELSDYGTPVTVQRPNVPGK